MSKKEYARCVDCDEAFTRDADAPWRVRCFPCWQAWNDRKSDRIAQVLATPDPDKPMISERRFRQLVALVHPDRHQNSKLANEVTAWLNSPPRVKETTR